MSDLARLRPNPSLAERLEGRLGRWLAHLPGSLLLRLIREAPHVVDGRTLDPHLQVILAAQRRKVRPGLCSPTVAAGRATYHREVLAAAGTPTPVAQVHDITVDGAEGPLAARHYVPASGSTGPAPVLLFLHGGGFVIGDLNTHDEPCRLLCHYANMHVVSVAYRLAPEHPFPAAVEDSIAALRWLQQHAAALGADATRVCVGGDSAGGNLAAVASLARARDGAPPAAQLLLYPATDSTCHAPSRTTFASGYLLEVSDVVAFRRHYLGDNTDRYADPMVSPALSTDIALSPPTLITTGGFDVLRDEGMAFATALRDAGVAVIERCEAGMIHGFVHMTYVSPGARNATIAIARALSSLVDVRRPR